MLDERGAARLAAGAAGVGVRLSAGQVASFGKYLALLSQWGRRVNLTAIREAAEVVDRHFVDSLALAPLVAPGSRLLDVGSGAGFPGAAVALVRPDVAVTLLESRAKKVAFLRALAHEVRLSVAVCHGRSEELARGAGREAFDLVVSRAVLPLERWIEHGPSFVAPGGVLVAMVGPRPVDLPTLPGFDALAPHAYELPDGTRRHLLRWRRGV